MATLKARGSLGQFSCLVSYTRPQVTGLLQLVVRSHTLSLVAQHSLREYMHIKETEQRGNEKHVSVTLRSHLLSVGSLYRVAQLSVCIGYFRPGGRFANGMERGYRMSATTLMALPPG